MPDIMIEEKYPSRWNFMRRLRDMLDGTFAEVVYVANISQAIEMRPVSNTLTTTWFTAVSQAALQTAVQNYLASSTKRFVSMNQYSGGIVTLFFNATVIEMPA